MKPRSFYRGAALVAALAASLGASGCSRDEPGAESERPSSSRIGERFPDRIGAFQAVGETRPGVAELAGRRLVSAEREYDDAGREATLRIVDVSRERSLVDSFAVARDMHVDELDALTQPIRIGHAPALVQWSRDTAESEVQVLVDERYLVTLKIWPANRREEASDVFPAGVVESLARAR